ncbi:HK97-gp10 family putative phage morphogenesis protein [Hymenobacter sublimis]|uniref:HK97 gp10 family phage protein n=1 Tax=Hymenobacter sublimis TaxID=2933777 RepID=A0ABY4JCI7_9BACT|nr:HK97-gp10 family putative phage morphogenesis protein [Hymenobacter sublimis]UPL50527.1 HK97 gp10 family phage protein [Hymenobacter sublimis]
MSATVKLEGADNLSTKLKAWATRSKQKVQAEVASTLLAIESDAKKLAPVDSGYLRSSIHANIKGAYAGSVTASAEYAVWVEFGNGRNTPQPFLYPAYHMHKEAFLRNVKAAIKFK